MMVVGMVVLVVMFMVAVALVVLMELPVHRGGNWWLVWFGGGGVTGGYWPCCAVGYGPHGSPLRTVIVLLLRGYGHIW